MHTQTSSSAPVEPQKDPESRKRNRLSFQRMAQKSRQFVLKLAMLSWSIRLSLPALAFGQAHFTRPRLQHASCLSSTHRRTWSLTLPLNFGSSNKGVREGSRPACLARCRLEQRDAPAGLGAVVAVSAGYSHTCAVRSDGQLACFGSNASWHCNVPAGLGDVVAVSAGFSHTCAVRSDGQLACFGSNEFGQCNVPAGLGPVVAVSSGYCNTCAVRSDGQLACFGSNGDGKCNVPAGLGPVLTVSAGRSHTCAVRSDGQLACFGAKSAFT